MEKNYQFLDIEINKPIYRKLSAIQFDNNSRYILVSVYSNFKPYDLTYASVKIYGIKKDKTVFFNNAKILDAVNGRFEIDLTEQCLACDGDVEIQILILGLDKARLSSNSFIVNVKKNIIDPVKVTSQDEWGILTQGLASLAEYDIYKNNIDRHDIEIKENIKKISVLVKGLESYNSIVINMKDNYIDSDEDYTEAFLRSIAKCSEGGTIYIPAGKYKVTPDRIKITSNIKLVGVGLPIVYTDKGTPYEFIIGNHDEDEISNIIIDGIGFDQSCEVGKFKPITHKAPTRGISFKNVNNIKVINNKFSNFMGQHCIIINETIESKNAKNIFIDNNTIEIKRIGFPHKDDFYDQSAIYAESDGHIISNNYIKSINTGSKWWELPGGIETHGSIGIVENNTIIDAMIPVNITPHWYPTGRTGKRIISKNNFVNCCEGVVIWASEDPKIKGDGINNIDIVNNYFGLKSTRNTIFGCGVGTTSDDNGLISNINIKNNTFEHLGNLNEYRGTNVLGAIDMSLFRFYNKNTIKNVVIENNYIKNFGGCILGISQVNIPQSSVHEGFVFTNNIIENCTYYTPSSIWNCSMFYLDYVKDIIINKNKIIWGNDINYPNDYGASHIFVSDHISNFEYFDNEYKYDKYFNILVNMNNYLERTTIKIDFNYLRKLRNNEFKINNIKKDLPTSGTFVIGDILMDYNFDTDIKKYTNFKNGSYGNSAGSCNVANNYIIDMVTANVFKHDTFVKCGEDIVAIVGKNGNRYFNDSGVAMGTNIQISYNAPQWLSK